MSGPRVALIFIRFSELYEKNLAASLFNYFSASF
jgi:hypothetical protein